VSLEREVIEDEKAITGDYTLILYGGLFLDDIKTIAILDSEDDDYEFQPYAPEFEYTVTQNMKGEEALQEAISFVSWNHLYRRHRVSRIMDTSGRTIAYEIRPLYRTLSLGASDVLLMSYVLKDRKVMVYMSLKSNVEDPSKVGGGNGDRKDK
jgi:hypothetical protein